MFPPEWDDINRSEAEHHIYRRLAGEAPRGWYAFHSVGLAAHEFKSWAEADFVVVGPFGILCIEAKGGRVSIEGGRWFTNGQRLKESPFSQAAGEAGALRRELRAALPGLRHVRVEYAVAFPDCALNVRGPGAEQALVYDARDIGASFRRFIDRVVEHWSEAHRRRGHPLREVTQGEQSLIASWVAPTITAVPSFRARLASAETEFATLTQRQAVVLRAMRGESRVLIRGGAGTGKTLLAVQEAERLAAAGRRVLLVCRSPHLAGYLRSLAAPIDGLVVRDIRSLSEEVIAVRGSGTAVPPADDTDLTTLFLPQAATEALIETDDPPPYDVAIIDEAQDLLLPAIVDFLDVLLVGGITDGDWRVFFDQKQNVFTGLHPDVLTRFEQLAGSRAHLVDNCRNTPEIATSTALLSGTPPDEPQASSGPKVVQHFADDARSEAAAIAEILLGWRQQGLTTDEVVALGPTHDAPAHIAAAIASAYPGVGWSSIDDFKGREAAAVMLTGLRGFDGHESRRWAYVGCSRARWLLAMVLPSVARASIERRARGFGELLAIADSEGGVTNC